MKSSFHPWMVCFVAAVFMGLSLLSMGAILPQPDEAVYANPGYNLAFNGHSGTTLYEMRGYMPLTVAEHTYWQLPLYFLLTPLWFKVTGFGLFQMRTFSLLFGVVGVASWYWTARKLSGSPTAGLLAMSLVGLDYFYMGSASTGRMDMLSCGLGAATLASYLILRERSLTRALFWSHVFATGSILAHPAGMMYWIGLLFLIWAKDRKGLSFRTIGAAIVPIFLGVVVLGAYLFPGGLTMFVDQMRANIEVNRASFEGEGLSSNTILRSLQLEWRHRYVAPFGLAPGAGLAQHVKALPLAAYAIAILAGLFFKKFKQQSGALAVMTLIAILYLALASPSKFHYYLAHVTGFMAAGLGVFLYSLGSKLGWQRWLAGAAFAGIALIGLAGNLYRIRQDPYHRLYLPVIELVHQNSTPQSTIMATGELWFGLEPDRSMIFDPRLGALSGKVPSLIVWAKTERSMHERAKLQDPPVYEHVQRILDGSRLIHEDEIYQIYLP